jgi:serine/threonine protein kinase
MAIRVEPQSEPIPGYRLIERLGGGGFGEVWKAEAPGGLLKAMKFVYGDIQNVGEESQRADQELKALRRVATVRHPNILSLERWDIIEGRLIIVMELADRNLWDRFKECRAQGLPGIPRDELLNYMVETAEALDLMNTQYQLQHLDIKPQNLFLVYNHVKVADFGLVKDLQDRMAATITGGVTPVYAAPETFDGWVSRYCDQYSLAIVYQELLTGQRPFAGTTVHQLVMQHVQGTPNLEALPREDRKAIGKALSKNPDERHCNCSDLIRILRWGGESRINSNPAGGVPIASQESSADTDRQSPHLNEATPAEESTTVTADFSVSGKPAAKVSSNANHIEPQSEKLSESSSELPVVTGEGQLSPALVIGLGETGRIALEQLRIAIQRCVDSPEALPNLRMLYLDSDPQALSEATETAVGGGLNRHDVLVTRLNRASHYLNPRNGRPPIDTWFDTALLYRITRDQVTSGLRPLGRLAFFGNYKVIASRLEKELTACTNPEALASACQQTGLTLRSNQPRVYVVTSLAGGTGSGMFIDLAYLVRAHLKKMGYPHSEIVGVFLLPQVESNPGRTVALGNAYAALTELNHFATPGMSFTARYDEREKAITNTAPPYSRCVLLSPRNDHLDEEETARLSGEFLYRELITALGPLAEASRMALTANGPPDSMITQTVGLYRLYWPRRRLLQRVSRRFCQKIVQYWLAKDTKPLQEKVHASVAQQWTDQQLGPEFMIARFQQACTQALGKDPESAFAAIIAPVLAKKQKLTAGDREALVEIVAQLEQIVGQPSESAVLGKPGFLEETLRGHGEGLTSEWQQRISGFTLHLIDVPEFRSAGAEEAIRNAGRLVEQVLTTYEKLCQELSEKAAKAHERLRALVANFHALIVGKRAPQLIPELVELLQWYPKWRYQSLMLRRVNYTYTSLRGFLSDQVREIGFYRIRLGELLSAIQRPAAADEVTGEANGKSLYPAGCTTLEQAVNHLFPEATPEELEELDRRMQNLLQQQFVSLRHVCTTPTVPLKRLEAAMLAEAEAFVSKRLNGTDVVSTYFNLHTNEGSALGAIQDGYDHAAPQLACSDVREPSDFAVLAVPAGQEKRFRPLFNRIAPLGKVIGTPHMDDLLFYQENDGIDLLSLDVLGPEGEEAYEQLMAAEHFPPHCRSDITEWQSIKD